MHNQILKIKYKINNIHYNDIEIAFIQSSGIKFIESSTNLSILQENYNNNNTFALIDTDNKNNSTTKIIEFILFINKNDKEKQEIHYINLNNKNIYKFKRNEIAQYSIVLNNNYNFILKK